MPALPDGRWDGQFRRHTRMMTARAKILAAAEALTCRSDDEVLRLEELVDEVLRDGNPYPEWTLRTEIVSRMTKGAPKHHATTYEDFEHVGRGLYRLIRR